MVTVSKHNPIEQCEMREAYCDALITEAERDEHILAIEADVMRSLGTAPFKERFPDRSINCGIQEANCIGVAAGLSVTGFIPFFHTFGAFASRRCFDQTFVSAAYAGLNVKIVGQDAGVAASTNGGTHMPFEDMGIMRAIPNCIVIEPCDVVSMKSVVKQMTKTPGVIYMRTVRKNVNKIYDSADMVLGMAETVKDGADVTLIACGLMVYQALQAARHLAKEGISARVVDMFTVKPIDVDCITTCAKETGAIVTAENHSIINGLGSAVAEVLSQGPCIPLEMVGIRDRFGEVGDQDYLMREFGITAHDIVDKAKKAIIRKG
jgi:transketolase